MTNKRLTEVKPAEPNMPDEATELETAENAATVREDRKNTSTSSGLPIDDEAHGEEIKELLRKGAVLVTRMD